MKIGAMLPTAPRHSRLVLLLCAVSLALLWGCRLPRLCVFSSSQPPRAPSHTESGKPDVLGTGPPTTAVDLSTADAPFVAWPLARVCAETPAWTPGLVFVCDNNSGGIGNMRNFVLTCVRYAVAAGATGLTMPTIQTRDAERLADLFRGPKVPLSHFFDEAHFRAGLQAACPRMTVYEGVGDVPGAPVPGAHGGEESMGRDGMAPPWDTLRPNDLGQRGGCDARDLNRHADLFGQRFRTWLRARQDTLGQAGVPSAAHPKLVRFTWGVQWTFPVWRDGPEFVATFGGLLRFRADVLALGTATAEAMERRCGGGGFLGMHLRTEQDALGAWPSFDQQSAAFVARAAGLAPRARCAYVATGNASEAARLAGRAGAAVPGLVAVLTKHELLAGPAHAALRRRLEALSWDQQALVDFVVLLRAEHFVGVSPSSFSMNVALKRHLKADGLYSRPWRVGVDEGDGRSWLVGRYDGYWEDWLFMYESLWP